MTEPEDSGAQPPVVAATPAASRFDRFSAVVLAALLGVVALALAMYVVAARLHIGGGGILYLVLFLVVGIGAYVPCAKLVRAVPWTRWLALVGLVIAVAYASISYKALGAQDPFVPAIVVLLPVALLYFFIPSKQPTDKPPTETPH